MEHCVCLKYVMICRPDLWNLLIRKKAEKLTQSWNWTDQNATTS